MLPVKDNIINERIPFVTIALIVANVVVYVLTSGHGGSLISGPDTHEVVTYGAIPYAFTHSGHHGPVPTWETAFTAMFMQGSILHLLGNMLFLWIFGNTVEDAMGPVKFVCFYILGGLVALALDVVLAPNSLSPTIGAAGAIATLLGGYIVLYPQARTLTLVLIPLAFTVIELPAGVMLGLWFVVQAVFGLAGLTNPTGGGAAVGYFAQLGGFVFGAVTVRLLATRRQQVPPPRSVF